MSSNLLEQLETNKIIAILRGIPEGTGEKVTEALYEGGIRFLEVTLDTVGALEMIQNVKAAYGENLRIGAGTVLHVADAEAALEAGAEYIVSPHFDEEIVTYCLSQDVPVLPGTMTPSEMVRATNLGAPAVKVFPAGALGLSYIKDLRGPLGHIPMIATGGVTLENIEEVLRCGVKAVGIGGNLVDHQLIFDEQYEEITKKAKAYVSKIERRVVHG